MFYVLEGPDSNGKVKLMAKGKLDYNDRLSNDGDGVKYSFCESKNRTYFINNNNFPVDSYGYKYVYRTTDGQDTKNNIYPHINAYKDYLKNDLGINEIIDARLMSYEEAVNAGCTEEKYSCKINGLESWSWYGSMKQYNEWGNIDMWFIHGDYNLSDWPIEYKLGTIQPLIEVDQSVFTNAIPITD